MSAPIPTVTCETCNGLGGLRTIPGDGPMAHAGPTPDEWEPCSPNVRGADECPECGGDGKVDDEEALCGSCLAESGEHRLAIDRGDGLPAMCDACHEVATEARKEWLAANGETRLREIAEALRRRAREVEQAKWDRERKERGGGSW